MSMQEKKLGRQHWGRTKEAGRPRNELFLKEVTTYEITRDGSAPHGSASLHTSTPLPKPAGSWFWLCPPSQIFSGSQHS